MPLQLFNTGSPLDAVGLSLRHLIAQGVLIQRELIGRAKFESEAGLRGIGGFDRDTLEAWDRDGVFSPLAFSAGPWTNWHSVAPYPLEGIVFREEEEFKPWDEYAYERWGQLEVSALYSEWQLLYLAFASAGETLEVPLATIKAGPDAITAFFAGHQSFVEAHTVYREGLHAQWLPTIRLLLRLQARYWPFVHGSSVLIWNDQHEHVDALDIEYERTDADALRAELGIDDATLEATYSWLARQARRLDPLPELYDLRRFRPRDHHERERGAARHALDFYDAANLIRRAYRELFGELLPDVDQLDATDASPRPLGRSRDQLGQALRRHRLYPHSLHMVVEGATEVCLVKRLFEAFSGVSWEDAGLLITDLRGDKLKGSRTMLEGFSVYADAVALLLDDENDARRITRGLSRDGVVHEKHVRLWDRNLEEDNFSPPELLEMVAAIGARKGAVLDLDESVLLDAQASRNKDPRRRQGLASVLQTLAQRQDHGSVVFTKPELAEQMAELVLREIGKAPGKHKEVGQRRPIVHWVLTYPLRAWRLSLGRL